MSMDSLLKIFDRLCYSQDQNTVFNDLLTVTLAQFTPREYDQSEFIKAVGRLNNGKLINDFVFSLVNQYGVYIEKRGWVDPLGDLYMDITGKYKSQRMGQFFTPGHLCTLMAKMQIDENAQLKNISDPACGSGRTLLAAKSIAPNNFFFAEDLDSMCVKMCAINFAFHGCIGEVINHNSLQPKGTYYGGFKVVNIGLPIPAIIPITETQSFICSGVNWFNPERKSTEKHDLIVEGEPLNLFGE